MLLRPLQPRATLTLLVATALAPMAALPLPSRADASKTWVVNGAGYGHGVGMSAWGAYGYGRHGKSDKAILKHYYAHLKLKRLPGNPEVRVLLGTSSAGSASFRNASLACGVALNSKQRYEARSSRHGILLATASGRTLKRCGRTLHAEGDGPIRIGGYGSYRGALSAVRSGSGLNVVNEVRVDDYARGSVPSEVPASWPKQTLRAFAIAIRSVALATDVGGKGFDLYADTRTQVYKGVTAEERRTNSAVRTTRGTVATYRGDVVATPYFSSSGGRTESRFVGGPAVPYFKSVNDPYDGYSPQHRWTVRFSQAEMNSRLGPYVDGRLRQIKVVARGDSPRIDKAVLVGTAGRSPIDGGTLAAALGLYDRWAYFRTRAKARPSSESHRFAPHGGLPVPGGSVSTP